MPGHASGKVSSLSGGRQSLLPPENLLFARGQRRRKDKPCVTTAPNHFPPDRGSKQRLLRQTTSQQDIWQSSHDMRRLWLLTARSAARHGFQLAI
jgi:hypothetical protein